MLTLRMVGLSTKLLLYSLMKVRVVPLRNAGLGNNFSFFDELVNLVTWWHRRSLLWEILERTFYLSFLRRYFGL